MINLFRYFSTCVIVAQYDVLTRERKNMNCLLLQKRHTRDGRSSSAHSVVVELHNYIIWNVKIVSLRLSPRLNRKITIFLIRRSLNFISQHILFLFATEKEKLHSWIETEVDICSIAFLLLPFFSIFCSILSSSYSYRVPHVSMHELYERLEEWFTWLSYFFYHRVIYQFELSYIKKTV